MFPGYARVGEPFGRHRRLFLENNVASSGRHCGSQARGSPRSDAFGR
jgi:hypothetical protein